MDSLDHPFAFSICLTQISEDSISSKEVLIPKAVSPWQSSHSQPWKVWLFCYLFYFAPVIPISQYLGDFFCCWHFLQIDPRMPGLKPGCPQPASMRGLRAVMCILGESKRPDSPPRRPGCPMQFSSLTPACPSEQAHMDCLLPHTTSFNPSSTEPDKCHFKSPDLILLLSSSKSFVCRRNSKIFYLVFQLLIWSLHSDILLSLL